MTAAILPLSFNIGPPSSDAPTRRPAESRLRLRTTHPSASETAAGKTADTDGTAGTIAGVEYQDKAFRSSARWSVLFEVVRPPGRGAAPPSGRFRHRAPEATC